MRIDVRFFDKRVGNCEIYTLEEGV